MKCPKESPICLNIPIMKQGKKEAIEKFCNGNDYTPIEAFNRLNKIYKKQYTLNNKNNSNNHNNSNNSNNLNDNCKTCSCMKFDTAFLTILRDLEKRFDVMEELIENGNIDEIINDMKETMSNNNKKDQYNINNYIDFVNEFTNNYIEDESDCNNGLNKNKFTERMKEFKDSPIINQISKGPNINVNEISNVNVINNKAEILSGLKKIKNILLFPLNLLMINQSKYDIKSICGIMDETIKSMESLNDNNGRQLGGNKRKSTKNTKSKKSRKNKSKSNKFNGRVISKFSKKRKSIERKRHKSKKINKQRGGEPFFIISSIILMILIAFSWNKRGKLIGKQIGRKEGLEEGRKEITIMIQINELYNEMIKVLYIKYKDKIDNEFEYEPVKLYNFIDEQLQIRIKQGLKLIKYIDDYEKNETKISKILNKNKNNSYLGDIFNNNNNIFYIMNYNDEYDLNQIEYYLSLVYNYIIAIRDKKTEKINNNFLHNILNIYIYDIVIINYLKYINYNNENNEGLYTYLTWVNRLIDISYDINEKNEKKFAIYIDDSKDIEEMTDDLYNIYETFEGIDNSKQIYNKIILDYGKKDKHKK